MSNAPTRRLRPVAPPPPPAPLPLRERVAHHRPVLTWLALDGGDAQAFRSLAAGPGVAIAKIASRSQPGVQPLGERGADGVAASPDQMRAAIGALLAGLPPHELVLLEGLPALTHVRASLSLVLTGGRAPFAWPEGLRAVRSEIDLWMPTLRPTALREIIARLRAAER